MGIVQSTLNKKKDKKINELETINSAVQNLQLFQNELEDKNIELQKKNTELQKENTILLHNINSFKINSEELINKIKKHGNIIQALECSICMDNISDNILLPCGHLFCSDCLNQFTNCPTCRVHILSKRRLYI